MPFSELTELVARLDQANLALPEESAALARRIAEIEALMDRLGATTSAAQLGLAASLLERPASRGDKGDEVRRTVRMLVVAVERAFRVDPVDGARALEVSEAVKREASEIAQAVSLRLQIARDMLLGEVLVHFGVVSASDIAAALELQQGSKKRLGEILVEQGYTTHDEITRALDYQLRVRSEIAEPETDEEEGEGEGSPSAPLPSAEKRPPPLRMATQLLLGEILILQGVITRKELAEALQVQRQTGLLLGETLLQLGHVTRRQIQSAQTVQGHRHRAGSRRNKPKRDK